MRILYYGLLKPLSLLPLGALYRLSDLAFLLVYYVIRYRRRVVMSNLEKSFPDKSPSARRAIARKYYRHLCDLAAESLRIFSIPLDEAILRNKVRNAEVADRFFREGRSVILAASHYNNWELCVLAAKAQLEHTPIGVYAPIKNQFLERKMKSVRGRYGLVLVSKREIKSFMTKNQDLLYANILAGDQAPSPSTKKVYHTTFLNQPTDVVYGAEKFARDYNCPVIYVAISKVRRGYYRTDLELLEEHPLESPPGSITERITRRLEEQILEEPANWLWSHKRWKKRSYSD